MQDRPSLQPQDAQDLTPLVYRELRRLAAAFMRRERPGQTLQATALVHEAYMRLAGAGTPWRDERHFVGLTVEETAAALGMSPATLKRRWALARAWLFRELSNQSR